MNEQKQIQITTLQLFVLHVVDHMVSEYILDASAPCIVLNGMPTLSARAASLGSSARWQGPTYGTTRQRQEIKQTIGK